MTATDQAGSAGETRVVIVGASRTIGGYALRYALENPTYRATPPPPSCKLLRFLQFARVGFAAYKEAGGGVLEDDSLDSASLSGMWSPPIMCELA
jgi:hypothetical protein